MSSSTALRVFSWTRRTPWAVRSRPLPWARQSISRCGFDWCAARRLAGNYRVLLRFLFDDGTVMASYDHDPPTPAHDWQPETPVTYTRRIFAPEVPYVGDVPVVVGLVSASGKRLPLFGKEVGDRMYEVARFKLHAQRILVVPLEAGIVMRATAREDIGGHSRVRR